VVCATPWAYWAYQDNQAYQVDVDRLYEVAGQLGYSEETHIQFYRIKTNGVDYSADLITLVFYSTASLDEFSNGVNKLEFVEKYYFENYEPMRAGFLSGPVNYKSPEKLVTLSGAYKKQDFDLTNRPPPIITQWDLIDTQGQRKGFTINYAQKSKDDDVWLFGDQPVPGNIVVVRLKRR
jgi:hypothetical protein